MILALLILVAIGTTGYRLLEGMNTIDAVYMTIITISTVGFGEIKPLSPIGRLFTIGLIVSGGGIAAYTFSTTATFYCRENGAPIWNERRDFACWRNFQIMLSFVDTGGLGATSPRSLRRRDSRSLLLTPILKKLPVFRRMVFWRCMVTPPTNNI